VREGSPIRHWSIYKLSFALSSGLGQVLVNLTKVQSTIVMYRHVIRRSFPILATRAAKTHRSAVDEVKVHFDFALPQTDDGSIRWECLPLLCMVLIANTPEDGNTNFNDS
jgi:hypothetical protein